MSRACRWKNLFIISCRGYSNQNSTQVPAKFKRRIFSGIQPTGVPHIGNYLGAIQRWVQLQSEYDDILYSIVDLHSVTLPQNPDNLRENILDMVACLLAVGIDPRKSIVFQQSAVPEHAELGWMLGCLTTLPRLEHLPQWKEKADKLKEVPLGLFTYPVLQSADILLYKATEVPVGDDQVKHIELTRHLANRFNNTYGTFFPKPKPLVGTFHRIRSLRNPSSKMSKSEADARGRIELTDSDDQITEKVRKAVTDEQSVITYDPERRPGISNLVALKAAVNGLSVQQVVHDASGLDTLGFKGALADDLVSRLGPIRQEFLRLRKDPGYLHSVLEDGRDRAQAIASDTWTDVKQLVGFM